ncbi:uncharacterized protein LOC122065121 [Macadamia integrifolia]|uniref:uncharacterized protein LOC122065121 n=1 Tax=Macadamia integrifolia TaxID=60698 RepID=UPI001C4F2F09|nr:uncharacterized protein LOC122065121 [Macadamia integrifolia]
MAERPIAPAIGPSTTVEQRRRIGREGEEKSSFISTTQGGGSHAAVPKGHVDVNVLNSGLFVFRLNVEEDRLKVLEGGLWFVQKKPFIIWPWSPCASLDKINLCSFTFWINLANLPFHYWSSESLSRIRSVIGKSLVTDKRTMTKERLSFACLCVEVNAGDELPSSVSVYDDEGIVFMQHVLYDWRPSSCSNCKIFGHSSSQCASLGGEINGDLETHNTKKAQREWRPEQSDPVDSVAEDDTQAIADGGIGQIVLYNPGPTNLNATQQGNNHSNFKNNNARAVKGN